MFNPTRDQARAFFIDAWRKYRAHEPLTQLETQAAALVAMHPEYHELLQAPDALAREWTPEDGQLNPFLHLSLHLAIEEQLSIDQPPGLAAAFDTARARFGDRHTALHLVLECLGETVWRAQSTRSMPDGAAYLDCVRRKVSS